MRKLLVRFLALGAHGIQMSSHSQTKLSDCLAPRRSTVLVACPQRLAVGQAQTHGLAVCVTQVRVALFGHGNTLPLSAGTVALGVRTHTATCLVSNDAQCAYCPCTSLLARIIHGGSSRKRAERGETGTRRGKGMRHTREYVEGLNGETARHSRVSALAAEAS